MSTHPWMNASHLLYYLVVSVKVGEIEEEELGKIKLVQKEGMVRQEERNVISYSAVSLCSFPHSPKM